MLEIDPLPRSLQRLADELDDDGVELAHTGLAARLVLEELDYCRRIPMFEGRRPIYGAFVSAGAPEMGGDGYGVDVVDIPFPLDMARPYADGRSAYLLRRGDEPESVAVACFDRALQYEADLVRLQEATGVTVIQRTPVLGVTRLFQEGSVLSWDGRSWTARPTAASLLTAVCHHAPRFPEEVVSGVLELALHWLSPARAGATLLVTEGLDKASFDTTGAHKSPALTLANRRHFPPVMSVLVQRDLATVVGPDGAVRAIGVALRASSAADAETSHPRGMRHRSAQRWSFDHPEALVVVVSEDGPVTVFCAGEVIVGTHADDA